MEMTLVMMMMNIKPTAASCITYRGIMHHLHMKEDKFLISTVYVMVVKVIMEVMVI